MAPNAPHAATAPQPASTPAVTGRGWRSEDWMAVFLGFLIIVAVIGVFNTKAFDLRSVVSSYRWTTQDQLAARAPGWIATLDGIAAQAESKGQKDVVAMSGALKEALQKNDRKAIESAAGKLSKLGSKTIAGALGAEVRGHAAASASTRVFTWDNLSKVVYAGIAYAVLAAAGIVLLGGRIVPFLIAFPAVFALAWLARFLAGNGAFIDWGIEYVIFALFIGL